MNSKATTATANNCEFTHEFEGKPDFALVKIKVPSGKTVKAEASAMVSMTPNIEMKTKIKGGFKRFLGGENIFINEFTAHQFEGELSLASGMPGDLRHYHLEDETIYLQSGGFLASGTDIKIESKWQGMIKGFFSGAGLFLLKCSGTGDIFLNSYGGIIEIDVKDKYTVDTKHIVGFTGSLDYTINKVGGYKSLFFSGEGLVAKFTGTGKVWIQTRNYPAFSMWVYPFRPVKQSNDD